MDIIKFVPEVVTDCYNQVVKVIFEWQGRFIPFGLGFMGRPYRLDYDRPDRLELSKQIYNQMFRQAAAIFSQTRPYILKENLLIWPAKAIHEKIADYLDLSNKPIPPTFKQWQKASWEIIRREENPEIYPFLFSLTTKEREWLKFLKLNGLTVLSEGWLSFRHWTRTKNSRSLTPLKIRGINSALRLTQKHIPGYYYEKPQYELDSLEKMETVLLQANQILDGWGHMSENDKKELQLKIVQIVLRLHNCKNVFMQKAKKQLTKTVSLKDRLGRPNPRVMIIRLDKTLEKLTDRLQEINRILPKMATRLEILLLEKRRLENNLKHAATTIKVLSSHRMFRTEKAKSRDLDDADKRIDQALSFLYTQWLSPYWEMSEQAKPYLIRAKQIIRQGKLTDAKKLLLEAYKILKTDMSRFG